MTDNRYMKYWNHSTESRAITLEGDHDGSGRWEKREYRVAPGRSVKIPVQSNPQFAKAIFLEAPWLKPISVTEILVPAVERPDNLYEEPKTRLAIEHHITYIQRELAIANGESKWMIIYKANTGKEAPQYAEAMARLQYLKNRLEELKRWKEKKDREESIAYVGSVESGDEMPQIKVERVGQPRPPEPVAPPIPDPKPEAKKESPQRATPKPPAASEGDEDEDAHTVSGSLPIAPPPSELPEIETPMPTEPEEIKIPEAPKMPPIGKRRGRPKRK